MSVLVGLCCEDRGHFRTATFLVDQTLEQTFGWDASARAERRRWSGYREEPWSKYSPTDAEVLPKAKRHGHIGGQPQQPDAGMWRNVLLLFSRLSPRPDVVILARDLDGDPRRLRGFEQVRDHLSWPFPVLLAAPEPEVEGWIVAGFEPSTPDQSRALETLRKELGFDPRLQSHRLTSHPNDAKADAKRVLSRLVHESAHESCLTDRQRLRDRGENNGLNTFLDQIERHVVPLFEPHRAGCR